MGRIKIVIARQADEYVANLVALGIIDAQGRLIPGAGVIGPPPP
jgi:hypothetical protein